MDRHAGDFKGQPHHAELGAQQAITRLGDDRGIGVITLHQTGERAIAGALFLDHRLQIDRGGRLQADRLQRPEGVQPGDDAGLHVGRAAPVEPVALDARRKGRRGPHRVVADRHHIDMPVENQRSALDLARPVNAHHIRATVVGDDRRRPSLVLLEFGLVDVEALDRQPHAAHAIGHPVLCAGFRAEQRGQGDEFGQHRDGIGAQGGGGLCDIVFDILCQCLHGVLLGGLKGGFRSSR